MDLYGEMSPIGQGKVRLEDLERGDILEVLINDQRSP
jgi:TusA-related sulfurtransferase